jgi:hypothetical protein
VSPILKSPMKILVVTTAAFLTLAIPDASQAQGLVPPRRPFVALPGNGTVPRYQPVDSEQQWCAVAYTALGNALIDPFQKEAILEKARNRGCFR